MSNTKKKSKDTYKSKKKTKNVSRHTNNKNKKQIIVYKPVKFTTKTNKCSLINNKQLYFLYLYFGIMSKLVNRNIELNTYYNLFYSKNEVNIKMLNSTKSFKVLDKLKCFFYTSNMPSNHNTDILMCNINDNNSNYILINFSIGITNYYKTTKSLLYYIKNNEYKTYDTKSDNIIHKYRFYELIILLSQIKHYLESKLYKNIILCGHSRGSTVASLCAYILLILSSNDDTLSKLPKHHNVKEFIDKMKEYILTSNTQEIILNKKLLEIKNNKEIYTKLLEDKLIKEIQELHKFNIICSDILNLKSLKNKIQEKLYICGTGGYPILWTKIEDFNIFNDFYLSKYIHLISGNKENNSQSYDNLTYYNKFIYIFSNIENIKNINNNHDNINHLDEEIEKLKHIKNINYVYKNFGSIILNLVNNNNIECYKMDSILNNLQSYDKKKRYNTINYNKNKLIIYHRFEFYRYLFIKYMKIV
jgi:hypothetical protein